MQSSRAARCVLAGVIGVLGLGLGAAVAPGAAAAATSTTAAVSRGVTVVTGSLSEVVAAGGPVRARAGEVAAGSSDGPAADGSGRDGPPGPRRR